MNLIIECDLPNDVALLIIEWQKQALSHYRLSQKAIISAPMRKQHTALAIVYTSVADELQSLYERQEAPQATEDDPSPT